MEIDKCRDGLGAGEGKGGCCYMQWQYMYDLFLFWRQQQQQHHVIWVENHHLYAKDDVAKPKTSFLYYPLVAGCSIVEWKDREQADWKTQMQRKLSHFGDGYPSISWQVFPLLVLSWHPCHPECRITPECRTVCLRCGAHVILGRLTMRGFTHRICFFMTDSRFLFTTRSLSQN